MRAFNTLPQFVRQFVIYQVFFLELYDVLSDNRGMTTRDTKKTRLSVRLSTQAAALLAAYERSLAGRSRRKVNRSWVIDRMIVAHFGKKEGAK